MQQPLINILIRTIKSRNHLLHRCLDSIDRQTYDLKKINLIIGSELPSPFGVEFIPDKSKGEFFYNDYCNILKDKVKEGYFFFLDDDDVLSDNYVLERISKHLTSDGVICQMKRRNGSVKPSDIFIENRNVISGKIGMPCLVLKAEHKNIADITCDSNGDFIWISKVNSKIKLDFIKEVLVYSPFRGHGK